jgi:hypothetical protein
LKSGEDVVDAVDDEGVSRDASARTAEFLKKRPWSSGESCVHVGIVATNIGLDRCGDERTEHERDEALEWVSTRM